MGNFSTTKIPKKETGVFIILLVSGMILIKPITRKVSKFLSNRLKEENIKNRPKRIILTRHGESEANINNSVYSTTPDNKISLTSTGFIQADEAGSKLSKLTNKETIKFYISPFLRTQQTFQQIIKHIPNYTWELDPRIREQERGNLQDDSEIEKKRKERKLVGSFFYRYPSGESGADVYDRVSQFLDTLHREIDSRPIDNIVIVAHGLFMRLFLMRYYKWNVEQFNSVCNPGNCDIWIMEKNTEGKYKLKSDIKYKDNVYTPLNK